jgi:hypothetical protein
MSKFTVTVVIIVVVVVVVAVTVVLITSVVVFSAALVYVAMAAMIDLMRNAKRTSSSLESAAISWVSILMKAAPVRVSIFILVKL